MPKRSSASVGDPDSIAFICQIDQEEAGIYRCRSRAVETRCGTVYDWHFLFCDRQGRWFDGAVCTIYEVPSRTERAAFFDQYLTFWRYFYSDSPFFTFFGYRQGSLSNADGFRSPSGSRFHLCTTCGELRREGPFRTFAAYGSFACRGFAFEDFAANCKC